MSSKPCKASSGASTCKTAFCQDRLDLLDEVLRQISVVETAVVVHLLVGCVDAELLQTVVAQVLEAEDVQQANGGAI